MLQPLEGTLPLGATDSVYPTKDIAFELLNFQMGDSGILRPVKGLLPYVPDYGSGYPSYRRMHGVFHTRLHGRARDVLLLRTGSELWAHRGWKKNWQVVETGLSDSPTQEFPDAIVEVAGKIVWCNGIDAPRIFDGYLVSNLGYNLPPSAPVPLGPTDTGDPVYRNDGSYSYVGGIGTPGDLLAGQDGSLLAGSWYYYLQYEDLHGNLSPLSPASRAVVLRTERTATSAGKTQDVAWKDTSAATVALEDFSVTIDDLTRQFAVLLENGPEGTKAMRLYRSLDAVKNGPEPHLLVRIPDNSSDIWVDSSPDSRLGEPAKRPINVPSFAVATEHGGRLVAGRLAGNPNRIILSEPSLPGTFLEKSFVDLPSPVTGLASYGGELWAWTDSAMFRIDLGEAPAAIPFFDAVGCVAPKSLLATGWGGLVWLAQDGLYQLKDGQVSCLSRAKYRTFYRGRMDASGLSSATWDYDSREYVLFLQRRGVSGTEVLTFDGESFRSRDYGITVAAACTTKDTRRLLLAAGALDGEYNIWSLNRGAQWYTPPRKTYRFTSHWLSPDASRRRQFNLSTLYLCLSESYAANLQIKVWGNGRRTKNPQWVKGIRAVPADYPGGLEGLVLGTDTLQDPRSFWVRVDVNLRSVDSISFSVEGKETVGDSGAFVPLAFALDYVIVDQGPRSPRGGT